MPYASHLRPSRIACGVGLGVLQASLLAGLSPKSPRTTSLQLVEVEGTMLSELSESHRSLLKAIALIDRDSDVHDLIYIANVCS